MSVYGYKSPGSIHLISDIYVREALFEADKALTDWSRRLSTTSSAGTSGGGGVVQTISADSGTDLTGDVNLIGGTGVTLNQSGQDITFNFSAGAIDHGTLGGLTDDDHAQYILVDGTRAFTGNQSMGSNKLTSIAVGTVSGDAIVHSLSPLNDLASATGQYSMGDNQIVDISRLDISPPTPGSELIDAVAVLTSDGSAFVGMDFQITVSPTTDRTAITTGVRFNLVSADPQPTTGRVVGFEARSNLFGTGDISDFVGHLFLPAASLSVDFIDITGFENDPSSLAAASQATNAYGFRHSSAWPITNFTNRWSFYADADPAHLADFLEMVAISTPDDPAAGSRRIFADSGNSDHLSVRTSAGATVDLEAAGGGGQSTHIKAFIATGDTLTVPTKNQVVVCEEYLIEGTGSLDLEGTALLHVIAGAA